MPVMDERKIYNIDVVHIQSIKPRLLTFSIVVQCTPHFSFTQKQWSLEDADINKIRALELDFGLSPLVARCLAPVLKEREPKDWLSPSFEQLHDPFLMKNMEKACQRLEQSFCEARENTHCYRL